MCCVLLCDCTGYIELYKAGVCVCVCVCVCLCVCVCVCFIVSMCVDISIQTWNISKCIKILTSRPGDMIGSGEKKCVCVCLCVCVCVCVFVCSGLSSSSVSRCRFIKQRKICTNPLRLHLC